MSKRATLIRYQMTRAYRARLVANAATAYERRILTNELIALDGLIARLTEQYLAKE
jgi:hypothetical protein